MTLKIKLRIFVFVLLFVFTIFLLVIPADFFDSGQSICVSVILLHRQCYACGLTRGIQHLIHFDFKQAYNYNWLSFIVFPLIIYLIIFEFFNLIKDIKSSKEPK